MFATMQQQMEKGEVLISKADLAKFKEYQVVEYIQVSRVSN